MQRRQRLVIFGQPGCTARKAIKQREEHRILTSGFIEQVEANLRTGQIVRLQIAENINTRPKTVGCLALPPADSLAGRLCRAAQQINLNCDPLNRRRHLGRRNPGNQLCRIGDEPRIQQPVQTQRQQRRRILQPFWNDCRRQQQPTKKLLHFRRGGGNRQLTQQRDNLRGSRPLPDPGAETAIGFRQDAD